MIYYTLNDHPIKTNLPPQRAIPVLEREPNLSNEDYLEASKTEYYRLCTIMNETPRKKNET